MTRNASTMKDFLAGKERREKFLKLLRTGKYAQAVDVCKDIPIHRNTYYEWRRKYKDFAAQVDAYVRPGELITVNTPWDSGFAAFRKKFFGNDSPWFHLRIIDALENSEPGSVTLITVPPEHGKTTLLEDWVCYKLALDPGFRISVGSEAQPHARKFIKRVQNRMEPDGSSPAYVHRFGPFLAPKGTEQARRQPWSADYFDVFKRGRYDERDYSLRALGMTSKIRGTRADLLVVDDPQSEETLSQSDELFRKFRHDWLSRPGSKGRTVILMTRVGEGDFAELLMESEVLSHHIMLPAQRDDYPGEGGWLWPEHYSEHEYGIMRKNVGEDGWDLSYMQIARPAHTQIFEKSMLETARDPMRTLLHVADRLNGHGILVGLDPGLGVAGITAASDGPKFEIVANRKRRRLSGTEALIGELEDVIHSVHLPEHPVTDLVIEANAWQRGLVTDDRILALQRTYGFRIHPHQTGGNKYDPDFGVPQMVHSLLREEITWPWGDEYSQRECGELEADMLRWRQGKKGTEVEQDSLMSTWFIWLLWRTRARRTRDLDTSGWASSPAPPVLIGGIR